MKKINILPVSEKKIYHNIRKNNPMCFFCFVLFLYQLFIYNKFNHIYFRFVANTLFSFLLYLKYDIQNCDLFNILFSYMHVINTLYIYFLGATRSKIPSRNVSHYSHRHQARKHIDLCTTAVH